MSMLDALTQAGGAQAISRELGVDDQTAQSGMSVGAVADESIFGSAGSSRSLT